MSEDRISTGDALLWSLAGAMAVGLFLLAPQLSANNAGRVVTVVLSAGIFACSIHPTLHSPSLHSNISRRIVLCFFATGIAAFGWILWPYSLNVIPSNVRFASAASSVFSSQTYSFRFTNRSDKDLYAAQLKFRIHSQTLSGKDFEINIPTASRKALSIEERRFADIAGLLCRDSRQRPLFSLFAFHLAPHESREITITNRRTGSAKVGATTGLFSTAPPPFIVNGNPMSARFPSDEPLSDCQSFGFLVDAHEHEGIYWFNHEGEKLDGKTVPQS